MHEFIGAIVPSFAHRTGVPFIVVRVTNPAAFAVSTELFDSRHPVLVRAPGLGGGEGSTGTVLESPIRIGQVKEVDKDGRVTITINDWDVVGLLTMLKDVGGLAHRMSLLPNLGTEKLRKRRKSDAN